MTPLQKNQMPVEDKQINLHDYCIVEEIGEFSYLDYLKEKSLANEYY